MTIAMGVGALVGALVSRPTGRTRRADLRVRAGLVVRRGDLRGRARPVARVLFVLLVAIVGAGQIAFLATCNSMVQLARRAVDARPRDGRVHDRGARQHADRRRRSSAGSARSSGPATASPSAASPPSSARSCFGDRTLRAATPPRATPTRTDAAVLDARQIVLGIDGRVERHAASQVSCGLRERRSMPPAAQLGDRGDRVGVAEQRRGRCSRSGGRCRRRPTTTPRARCRSGR